MFIACRAPDQYADEGFLPSSNLNPRACRPSKVFCSVTRNSSPDMTEGHADRSLVSFSSSRIF